MDELECCIKAERDMVDDGNGLNAGGGLLLRVNLGREKKVGCMVAWPRRRMTAEVRFKKD